MWKNTVNQRALFTATSPPPKPKHPGRTSLEKAGGTGGVGGGRREGSQTFCTCYTIIHSDHKTK